jgi:predicted deacylase
VSIIGSHLESLAAGAKARGRIPVGTLASGRAIEIPYLLLRGMQPGRCLWINGQVHGDEINGIMAALGFFHALDPSELRGSVVVVPTANPLAFDARRKKAPQDEQDLDQTFPGRDTGFISDRMAHALFLEASGAADVLLSLHAIGAEMDAVPYCVYKLHANGRIAEGELLSLIACFRPSVACRQDVAAAGTELPGNIAGALDYQMLALGKPAFNVEIGCAARLQPELIDRAVAGLRRVAGQCGLLPVSARPGERLRRVTRRAQISCSHGGIFRPRCRPGEVIGAGVGAGEIVDLYGDTLEKISFAQDVIVIALRQEPVVHSGDRVLFVAQEWDEVSA